MIAMLIAKTTVPGSPVHEGQGAGGEPRAPHTPEDRLHVSALVWGLIDARACHVDFLDTSGGQELERWYRRRRQARRHVSR